MDCAYDGPPYAERLARRIREKGNVVCVGLDPRWEELPPAVVRNHGGAGAAWGERAAGYAAFCCSIIDIVAPLVPAVKPQAAFFEELGPPGMAALAEVIAYARKKGLIVIADAKRGDIGSTAEAYARGWLAGGDAGGSPWGADALTVNAYLGADALEPFISRASACGGGIYVLVRTSNPGAGRFQDRSEAGVPLFRSVALLVEELASRTAAGTGGGRRYGCVGAVVGATWPKELAELRAAMPHAPLLIPGYGAQGAGAADVRAGLDADGQGAVVNSSRGIIFAHRREPWNQLPPERWPDAVEAATRTMIADLNRSADAGSQET